MSRLILKVPLYGVLILCLFLGSYLRLSHVEKKTFWYDETYTAIPVSGQTKRDVKEDWLLHFAQTGSVLRAADLSRYQTPQPGTHLIDAIASLGAEEAHNSPLYFILARPLLSLTTISPIIGMRGLSIFFGLLSLGGLFWLCQALFSNGLISGLATSLMAVSPFHILYAQEARQYSLFTATVVFSSVFLLRSLKSNKPTDWRNYLFATIAGLYTQPLFIFTNLAHGLYVLLARKVYSKGIFQRYLSAARWSYVAFLPWAIVILLTLGSIADWRRKTVLPLTSLTGRWIVNMSRSFYDRPLPGPNQYDFPSSQSDPLLLIWMLIFGLGMYSFIYLVRISKKQEWLFILSLAAVPALPFMLSDIVLGGVRSAIPRYFIPCYIALGLAVAYCLGHQIQKSRRSLQKLLWTGSAIALLLVGLFTSAQAVQADTWWHKYSNIYDRDIASIINSSSDPLLLGDEATRLISLSYRLRPDVPIQLLDADRIKEIPPRSHLFLYGSTVLRETIEQQKGLCSSLSYEQPLYYTNRTVQLWQLKPCTKAV
ncbi:hypothetical protein PN498_04245 [Oscillatoria sp. CS-180]|uniref:glycosyltransferase family 39 protein n=1 Tax=Oscillatoria sp. CS-180 TaxID=3021720 RepID=UPI0023307CD9|nr:hypothetical protein [Oscillatoria sp. CS-180]MDB9525186.1 hypothetical protein [Oscillatoria sp. CS-180]